jgi:hypothetical protein
MVSKTAESRRKRFLKIKENYSDINDMIRENAEQDVNILFSNEGSILSVMPVSVTLEEGENKIVRFTKDQASILEGKNVNDYIIKTDPIHDTKHTIIVRPQHINHIKTSDFIEKIEKSKSRSYDISIKLENDNFIAKLSSKTKKLYEDIDPKTASIKGIKFFSFYLTVDNDPHYMLHTVRCTLHDLLIKKQVKIKIPKNLTQCDVYTMKIFDKYVRT